MKIRECKVVTPREGLEEPSDEGSAEVDDMPNLEKWARSPDGQATFRRLVDSGELEKL